MDFRFQHCPHGFLVGVPFIPEFIQFSENAFI